MSEEQIAILFKYMQKGFTDIDNRLDQIEVKFDNYIQVLADKPGVDLDRIHI